MQSGAGRPTRSPAAAGRYGSMQRAPTRRAARWPAIWPRRARRLRARRRLTSTSPNSQPRNALERGHAARPPAQARARPQAVDRHRSHLRSPRGRPRRRLARGSRAHRHHRHPAWPGRDPLAARDAARRDSRVALQPAARRADPGACTRSSVPGRSASGCRRRSTGRASSKSSCGSGSAFSSLRASPTARRRC